MNEQMNGLIDILMERWLKYIVDTIAGYSDPSVVFEI